MTSDQTRKEKGGRQKLANRSHDLKTLSHMRANETAKILTRESRIAWSEDNNGEACPQEMVATEALLADWLDGPLAERGAFCPHCCNNIELAEVVRLAPGTPGKERNADFDRKNGGVYAAWVPLRTCIRLENRGDRGTDTQGLAPCSETTITARYLMAATPEAIDTDLGTPNWRSTWTRGTYDLKVVDEWWSSIPEPRPENPIRSLIRAWHQREHPVAGWSLAGDVLHRESLELPKIPATAKRDESALYNTWARLTLAWNRARDIWHNFNGSLDSSAAWDVHAWALFSLAYNGLEQTLKEGLQTSRIRRDQQHKLGDLFEVLESNEGVQTVARTEFAKSMSLYATRQHYNCDDLETYLRRIGNEYTVWRYRLREATAPVTEAAIQMIEAWRSILIGARTQQGFGKSLPYAKPINEEIGDELRSIAIQILKQIKFVYGSASQPSTPSPGYRSAKKWLEETGKHVEPKGIEWLVALSELFGYEWAAEGLDRPTADLLLEVRARIISLSKPANRHDLWAPLDPRWELPWVVYVTRATGPQGLTWDRQKQQFVPQKEKS